MGDSVSLGNLHFLFREQLYHNFHDLINGLEPNLREVSKFYRGLYFISTNKLQDAWNIFSVLRGDPSMSLASLLAIIYLKKNADIDSEESVAQIETFLRNERKRADEKALYFASLYLHLSNRQEKAREYAEKMLSVNPTSKNINGLVLRGWIELSSNDKTKKKNPLDYFNSALDSDISVIEGHLGKIRALVQAGNSQEALTAVNTAISLFPNNPEFVLEKLRVFLASKDWDALSELTKKVLSMQSTPLTVKVLEIQILTIICHDGSFIDAVPLMKKLLIHLEKSEPSNGEIFISSAKLFSRICGRHIPILNECQGFVEKALQIDEKNLTFMMELARQQILQAACKEAASTLKAITQLGSNSVYSILLNIRCLLLEDQYEAAQRQLNMLEDLSDSSTSYPEFLFIKAMILRHRDHKEAFQLLKQACANQVKNASWLPYSADYLIELNPDFLLSIAEEYFQNYAAEETSVILTELSAILACVVEACPGLLPALYRLANVNFMLQDYRSASSTLHHIIDHIDPTCIDSYLLMAEIGLEQSNLAQATQYLEMGLSYNFQIRDHPRYHLLSARVQRQKKEYNSALSSLRTAMILSGMRPASAGTKRSLVSFSISEKASTYLELFHVLTASGQKEDAGQVIQEAVHELKGTSQEGLLILAMVDYRLEMGDIDGALSKLKSISPNHAQYLKAREKMAEIYLHRLQDEALYLQSYKEIANQQPTVRNLSLVGDAYLALHKVDQAVSAYEEALKLEPKNSRLASKIGAALVLTHQYTKALNYYKDALRNDETIGCSSLQVEYASLLIRLGQIEKAEKIINEALSSSNKQSKEPLEMMLEVRLLLLLAKVQEKAGNQDASYLSLRKAQGIISSLLKKTDQANEVREQKSIATAITVQMASHAFTNRDLEAAIRLYREALTYTPDDLLVMAHLAKAYLQIDDVEHCQHMCKSILKLDRENEQAMMMIAQIALRKNDLETATLHFCQALEREPCHFEMLGQFIDVCRRRGNVSEAQSNLKSAENSSVHGLNDPGLSYCQGLYDYYSGQHNKALLALNRTRGHAVWGQYGIRIMLDICLNSDSETLGNVSDVDGHYEVQDTELMALHTASKLLQELQPVENDTLQTHILYPNLYLLATKQKANVERALNDLTAWANKHHQQDNPGFIFGSATAYLFLKQSQRAKNQLKRVIKAPWSLEDGEYLERCWLLLSDIYIHGGQNKMEVANDLLRRILTYNKSCAKAYEYLGYIAEKEQSYREAATHFQNSWKITDQRNSNVGYRLALNFLKSKQFTDAIDIGQEVLAKYPDHPKIRKDVLDKAITNVRA